MIELAQTPDARAALVAYIASKTGTSPQAMVGSMPFQVVAVRRDGKVMGAVLYINYRETSIEMAAAGEPGWLTKGAIRQFFEYPFKQIKVYTVLTMVLRRNKTAREFNRKLGFVELCTIPCGDRESDTILYGMTRGQCHWVNTNEQAAA